jgi:hypothetical protein
VSRVPGVMPDPAWKAVLCAGVISKNHRR